MNQSRARGINNDDKNEREHHRRAEVRLDHDECGEPAGNDAAGQKRSPEIAFLTGSLLEEVGEKNYQCEF